MFTSLTLKTLYDKRWFFVGWTGGTVTLLALTAAFYPAIADSIGDLLSSIPPALASIVGDSSAYNTYVGYIGSAVYGSRAEMVFVPLAVILGLSLSVNEELSGRMYQLLAQPVSRKKIILQKWLAGFWLIAAVMVITLVSMVVVSLAIGETVPYGELAKISLMSGLFTFMVFSLTFGVGIAFGRRSIAIIVPVVWVMGSLLLDSFATQVDWLKEVDWLSVHQYYSTSALVNEPIALEDVLVLSGISVASFMLAVVLFQRRDIREAE